MNKLTKPATMRAKKNNKGFSLVELIIVIAIMAILTALLAPQFLKYVERSREAADATNVQTLVRALEIACLDYTSQAEYQKTGVGVYIAAGGNATYSADGFFGGINPSLVAYIEEAFGLKAGTNGAASNQIRLPELKSKKYRNHVATGWTTTKGVYFRFARLSADGTITRMDGSGPGSGNAGGMFVIQYDAPGHTGQIT